MVEEENELRRRRADNREADEASSDNQYQHTVGSGAGLAAAVVVSLLVVGGLQPILNPPYDPEDDDPNTSPAAKTETAPSNEAERVAAAGAALAQRDADLFKELQTANSQLQTATDKSEQAKLQQQIREISARAAKELNKDPADKNAVRVFILLSHGQDLLGTDATNAVTGRGR